MQNMHHAVNDSNKLAIEISTVSTAIHERQYYRWDICREEYMTMWTVLPKK